MKKWKYYHQTLLNVIMRETCALEEYGNGSDYMRGCKDAYDIIYMEIHNILEDLEEGKHDN